MTSWAFVGLLAQSAISWGGDGQGTVHNKVELILQISGLGPEGCEIEIKPGHQGCRFEPVTYSLDRVPKGTVARIDPIRILAESAGADRDCSFAITLREPNKPPRSFVRGVRLKPELPGQPVPEQTLRCYVSTPSIASKDDRVTRRR